MTEYYNQGIFCNTCDYQEDNMQIEKGKKISEALCPRCKNNTLVKKHAEPEAMVLSN